jgi:hypothetical protein
MHNRSVTVTAQGEADVNDAFISMGGDPKDKSARVSAEHVREVIAELYGLDVRMTPIHTCTLAHGQHAPPSESFIEART